ncbi:MAG: hypothetical protein F6K22_23500 [Okeania sp. SIO2F4]|nr:hypothetical protein [Okeania sp. SIO2F4]
MGLMAQIQQKFGKTIPLEAV